MTRRPVTSIDSLQSLTVIRAETSKPYSVTHNIDRNSCDKRVPPVSNPYFLVFGYYFVIFIITVVERKKTASKVELKILLEDFSSVKRTAELNTDL